MALEIDSTVSITAAPQKLTLEKVREFVENTATWAGETKVDVLIAQNGIRMQSKYGDVTGNY